MILLWDVDAGLAQLDKFFHSNDNHIIAGALLGVGIVNCGIKNDCDPVSSIVISHMSKFYVCRIVSWVHMFNRFQALALLADYIGKEDSSVRIGAILGLGLAYAGCQNDQVMLIVFTLVNFWENET